MPAFHPINGSVRIHPDVFSKRWGFKTHPAWLIQDCENPSAPAAQAAWFWMPCKWFVSMLGPFPLPPPPRGDFGQRGILFNDLLAVSKPRYSMCLGEGGGGGGAGSSVYEVVKIYSFEQVHMIQYPHSGIMYDHRTGAKRQLYRYKKNPGIMTSWGQAAFFALGLAGPSAGHTIESPGWWWGRHSELIIPPPPPTPSKNVLIALIGHTWIPPLDLGLQ